MDAKKCDRCGAFYMPQVKTNDYKTSLEQLVTSVKKPQQKYITDVCDLCPECVKKFYDWLRSESYVKNP